MMVIRGEKFGGFQGRVSAGKECRRVSRGIERHTGGFRKNKSAGK